MGLTGYRAGTGYAWVRAVAKLACGVDLHAESGQVHESVAGKDLIEPFTGRPDLDEVVAIEPHGRDFDGDLLVITRTITWAAPDWRKSPPPPSSRPPGPRPPP